MRSKRDEVLRQEAEEHEAEVAARTDDDALEFVTGRKPRDPVEDGGWRPREVPVDALEDPLQQGDARILSSTEEDVEQQGRVEDDEEDRDWQGQPEAEAERTTRTAQSR